MITRAALLSALLPPAIGAMLALAAVAPPMHAAADASLAAHMVQHLVLILAAAPLLVLGDPVRVAMAMLPGRVRRSIGRCARLTGIGRGGRALAVAAWLVHVVGVWTWHAPRLYEWAIVSPTAHVIEHLSLLSTACGFWAVVFSGRTLGPGGAVLYLFAAAGQGTVLGALLTFSETPWYPTHAASVATWGLTPLEDQHLAGLIMWIPGGLVYAGVALAMLARVLRDAPRPVSASATTVGDRLVR
jgi:putative membrane protein